MDIKKKGVNRYFKRFWDETAGDDLTDSWGKSSYFFEIDGEGDVVRQLQLFSNGKKLKYYAEQLEDEYGSLSDQPLDHDELEEFEIGIEEFEREWQGENA
jgi:hypothetical protein